MCQAIERLFNQKVQAMPAEVSPVMMCGLFKSDI